MIVNTGTKADLYFCATLKHLRCLFRIVVFGSLFCPSLSFVLFANLSPSTDEEATSSTTNCFSACIIAVVVLIPNVSKNEPSQKITSCSFSALLTISRNEPVLLSESMPPYLDPSTYFPAKQTRWSLHIVNSLVDDSMPPYFFCRHLATEDFPTPFVPIMNTQVFFIQAYISH